MSSPVTRGGAQDAIVQAFPAHQNQQHGVNCAGELITKLALQYLVEHPDQDDLSPKDLARMSGASRACRTLAKAHQSRTEALGSIEAWPQSQIPTDYQSLTLSRCVA